MFDASRGDVDSTVNLRSGRSRSLADRLFGLTGALQALSDHKVALLLTRQPGRDPCLRQSVDVTRRNLPVRSPAEASG